MRSENIQGALQEGLSHSQTLGKGYVSHRKPFVKTTVRHARKAIQFYHSSAVTFTCLALGCSLLEVESEELGIAFKNTKQEVQKTQTEHNVNSKVAD